MSDSEIWYNDEGEAVSFVGEDATRLYAIASLASAIALHNKTGMIPTRGVTITKMMKSAESITHKKYKRTKESREQAVVDLKKFIQLYKSVIPTNRI